MNNGRNFGRCARSLNVTYTSTTIYEWRESRRTFGKIPHTRCCGLLPTISPLSRSPLFCKRLEKWKIRPVPCTMAVVTSSVESGGANASDVNAILNELATECGVATWYTGQNGQRVEVQSSTVLFALRELGLDLPEDPDALTEEIAQAAIEDLLRARYSRMLPPTVTAIADRPRTLHVHCIDGESLQVQVLSLIHI